MVRNSEEHCKNPGQSLSRRALEARLAIGKENRSGIIDADVTLQLVLPRTQARPYPGQDKQYSTCTNTQERLRFGL